MNEVKCYIKEIHNIKDVTEDYIKRTGKTPNTVLYDVDITFNCEGSIRRDTIRMNEDFLNKAKENNYFLS